MGFDQWRRTRPVADAAPYRARREERSAQTAAASLSGDGWEIPHHWLEGWRADASGLYVNLKANPQCEIRIGSKRMRAPARTASGDERTRGWNKMAAMYPPYNDYQKRAGSRQIPVVVLEPTGPA